jgi:hypothetical protein
VHLSSAGEFSGYVRQPTNKPVTNVNNAQEEGFEVVVL